MSTTAELDSNSREACIIQQGRQQRQQRQTPYRKVLVLVVVLIYFGIHQSRLTYSVTGYPFLLRWELHVASGSFGGIHVGVRCAVGLSTWRT
jgi:hypothetical protein